MDDTPRICDYEGSTYRTDFWEGRGRSYEDLIERRAIRRLLPAGGRRLLELGAGFGRLSEEYSGYDQVVLLDYSFSQLQYARERLGDERYLYVAADAYHLPFQPAIFDAATMIRVIHHFENVPAVLGQVQRVMASGGVFLLEYANKRNLKAMLRYALRRQNWNPYSPEPVEFVELNFDFHPRYMREALGAAGFALQQQVPVSFLRLGLLKRTLPTGLLVALDGLLQRSGWLVAPSVFTRSTRGEGPRQLDLTGDALFACPRSGGPLRREGDVLVSEAGLRWAVEDGIYNFKAPLES